MFTFGKSLHVSLHLHVHVEVNVGVLFPGDDGGVLCWVYVHTVHICTGTAGRGHVLIWIMLFKTTMGIKSFAKIVLQSRGKIKLNCAVFNMSQNNPVHEA